MRRDKRFIFVGLAAAGLTALVLGVTQALSGGDDPSSLDALGVMHRSDPAPGSVPETLLATEVDSGTWSITRYENSAGELCFGENVPGEGRGATCSTPEEFLKNGPLYVELGARQRAGSDLLSWDNSWVNGLVAPEVKRLELLLTDCSTRPVGLDRSGLFLAVVGRGLLQRGAWPQEVIAYDAGGGVLGRVDTRLEPPDTDAAKAANEQAPPRCK